MTLKSLVAGASELVVLPLVLLYRAQRALVPSRADEIFRGYSQLLSLLPGISGNFVRRAFYRFTVTRCPRSCWIGFGTLFATPEIEIGDNVYIGVGCMLGHVTLGDDVLLGSRVDILSGKRQHHFDRLDLPIRHQGGSFERVTVGRDCWIGNGAIVAADVGIQAVVAAGAVVVKPVPPRQVVGGNPARAIAERGHDDRAVAGAATVATEVGG